MSEVWQHQYEVSHCETYLYNEAWTFSDNKGYILHWTRVPLSSVWLMVSGAVEAMIRTVNTWLQRQDRQAQLSECSIIHSHTLHNASCECGPDVRLGCGGSEDQAPTAHCGSSLDTDVVFHVATLSCHISFLSARRVAAGWWWCDDPHTVWHVSGLVSSGSMAAGTSLYQAGEKQLKPIDPALAPAMNMQEALLDLQSQGKPRDFILHVTATTSFRVPSSHRRRPPPPHHQYLHSFYSHVWIF